jgi:hypothetical protein
MVRIAQDGDEPPASVTTWNFFFPFRKILNKLPKEDSVRGVSHNSHTKGTTESEFATQVWIWIL